MDRRLRCRRGTALRATIAGLLLALGAGCERPAPPAPADGPATPPKARALAPGLGPAASAIEQRRFDEGRALAKAWLDAHPGDGQAQFLLGLASYWTGNHGAARPWFEGALAAEPDMVVLHDFLGHCLLMLGELDAAQGELEAYAAAVPGDPRVHYRLGLIALEETRLDLAAERFRHAIERFEALDARQQARRRAELAECHARLGEVFFARGDHAAARAELERATAIAPENISAFYTLSLVLRRLGEDARADEAEARYEAARSALLEQQAGPR